MALSPVIVIGCGGSGGKVVLNLKRRISDELERRGWHDGLPSAWQFRWIDVPTTQERHSEFGPPLRSREYVALAPSDTYSDVDEALCNAAGQNLHRMAGWRPSPSLNLTVSKGAGQMRAVGRAVALTQPNAIADSIRTAVHAVRDGGAELSNLADFLSGRGDADGVAPDRPPIPLVFVVSSLAGGTGSGVYLDVCDIVRRGFPELTKSVLAVLFTAEVFKGVKLDGGMAPNTAASFAELGAGALSGGQETEALLGQVGAQAVDGHGGPNATFVVGLSPLGGGAPLASATDCYRSVTETLLATMMNEKFAGDFAAYQLTNFYESNTPAKRATRWSMLNQELGLNIPSACGYVSSFGSARLSVGSARFGEWAVDRMSRAAIDYLTEGWRDRGLELLDPTERDTASDQQIVDFLVNRDRNPFVEACGLWEEDEPDGSVKHDQVLEGILSESDLSTLRDEFKATLIGEMRSAGQGNAGQWSGLIDQLVQNKSETFRTLVQSALLSGRDRYAAGAVDRVSTATSTWLAAYGLPVTQGLVAELIRQCTSAVDQLRKQAAEARSESARDVSPYVQAALADIGNQKVQPNNDFVARALLKALGPLSWTAAELRFEAAAAYLGQIQQRVLDPLRAELKRIGTELEHPEIVETIKEWPSGPDVSEIYRPPASEFSLMDYREWDAQYESLLVRSEVGTSDGVRDLILAGGFHYGPVADRQTAPQAVEIVENGSWWSRDGRSVTTTLRLGPVEVSDRVKTWMKDDSQPFGRFMKAGLSDYLSDDHEDINQRARQDRLRVQLSAAIRMARPLFSINPGVMGRVHTVANLDEMVMSEDFPFASSHPARSLISEMAEGAGIEIKFREDNNDGIESVLILSNLVNPVQPCAVESLYGPIGRSWLNVTQSTLDSRDAQIGGFNMNRRARLLTEAIPLPQSSIDAIIRGWSLGRLLGVVTDPGELEPVKIWARDQVGNPTAAAMPWPVLRHGKSSRLDRPSHRGELLPAFLEHFGLAMMLVSQDDTILDGYQALFELGQNAEDAIERWIHDGETPVGQSVKPMLGGTDAQGRQDDMLNALSSLAGVMTERYDSGLRLAGVKKYEQFAQVPYGWEIIPWQQKALLDLSQMASSMSVGGSVDYQ